MKSAFPGQFSSNTENIKTLWNEAVIALDANVLLDLYRYSDSTRAAFFNVLELMKDRVWISNQVASEYFSNRLSVICDQAKHYEDAIRNLEKLKSGFENQKQHPFVVVETLNEFVESFDKVVAELKESKEGHERRISSDEIKEKLGELFEGKVGGKYDEATLEKIIIEGVERYKNKVPPGFKDSKKPAGESLKERCVPYGDYIGWLQLIDHSKKNNCGVIYVTGDVKEDWWLRHLGKTVGPLPELVEEFVDKTSTCFYMYQPDRFLEFANKFLKQDASPAAVEEIREVAISDFYDEDGNKSLSWISAHELGEKVWFDPLGNMVSSRRHHERLHVPDERTLPNLRPDGTLEYYSHWGHDGVMSALSESGVSESDEIYFRGKINSLQREKIHLRSRQAKQISILNELGENFSDAEYQERSPSIKERINSLSHQINVINEELITFEAALAAIRYRTPDNK